MENNQPLERRKQLLSKLKDLIKNKFFPNPHFCKSGDFIATRKVNANGETEIVYIPKIQQEESGDK